MSVASEITRLQNAKASLKTSINAKTDTQHQITNETIDEYSYFVDSITSGGGMDWSVIGYNNEPEGFTTAMDYAKDIYDNWDSTRTNFVSMFSNDKVIKIMPNVDTSNGTQFNAMFYNAVGLAVVPPLNTSNGTLFHQMFQGCSTLEVLPEFELSKATRIESMTSDITNLTKFGGLKNVGQSYSTSQSANYNRYKINCTSSKLDHDSLMNIINKVYDIATRGCNTQALNIGSTNLAKLTAEEIAIATNKGWTVS